MSANKKIIFIVTVMLILLSLSTIINVVLNLRDFAINNAIEKSNSIAESVRDGLTIQMLNGSLNEKELFLENTIKHQNIKNLKLLRSESVQKQFSNIENISKISNSEKQVLETKKSVTKIEETSKQFTMNIAIPYIATTSSNPNCLTCHSDAKEGDVLGVISMDVDMDSIKNEGILIIIKIVLITLVFLGLSIIITKNFIKPYIRLFEDLELGINKAYKGDFSHKVSTSLNDDAGKVAQRLNELTDIFKFKKIIEANETKQDIYNQLVTILINYLNVEYFILSEIDNYKNSGQLIYKSKFENDTSELIYLNFDINDNYSLLLQINCKSRNELKITKEKLAIIKNYFDIAKPVLETKILMNILKENSQKDALTQLYNRRYLDEFTKNNRDKSFSILMLDIDYFKQVNDYYGHNTGDEVLKGVSTIIKTNICDNDFAVRFGGEEFLIFLFNVDPNDAVIKANCIKQKISEKVFISDDESFTKTASIGVSHHSNKNTIWESIKFADIALYKAKNSGRDKVIEFRNNMYKL